MTRVRLAVLDLAEGNAMRAPGEAPGLMALEIAMDEMAEKLGMDPVQFRVINDIQVDPEKPERPFSIRQLVACLKTGADRFGWSSRNPKPGQVRDGHWLVGMGMAGAIRGGPISKAGARVRLDKNGKVTVETDMTDIGTGSYTIVAQTAAEMMGVGIDDVVQTGRLQLSRDARLRRPTGRTIGYRWRVCRVREDAGRGRAAAGLQLRRRSLR
jgi:xanthine dehydrogenase YagR molybdenum-binding subunit